MLRFLSCREAGVDDPLILRRAEVTRRAYALDLSATRDVEHGVHSGAVNCLDIDPVDGRYLLSGSSDGIIGVFDLFNSTGKITHTCKCVCKVDHSNPNKHTRSINTVQWYPLDTGLFTSSGTDHLLKVWDTNSLLLADSYNFEKIVYCHHMSPIATLHCLVAVGCDKGTVNLVDLKSGSSTHILQGHKKAILCAQWSKKDEFILATGSQDNKVLLWDIRMATSCLMTLDQYNGEACSGSKHYKSAHSGRVNGMCYTSNGLFLVTFGTDNCIHLWNSSTGRNTLVNYGRINNKNQRSVKITVSSDGSPDLIYVPDDSNIVVFEMFSGTKIGTLQGHYNQVNCCIFEKQLQELYSGGNDRNILVWQPDGSRYATDSDQKGNSRERTQFVRRIGATADTWSSDED